MNSIWMRPIGSIRLVGDSSEHLLVRHRRLIVGVHKVAFDVHPGERTVELETGLRRRRLEDVLATLPGRARRDIERLKNRVTDCGTARSTERTAVLIGLAAVLNIEVVLIQLDKEVGSQNE